MELPDTLKRTYLALSPQYQSASVRISAVKVGEDFQLLRGSIRFLREKAEPDQRLDYGALLLEKRTVSPEQAMSLIDEIASPTGQVLKGFNFKVDGRMKFNLGRVQALYPPSLPDPVGSFRFDRWPARTFVLVAQSTMLSDPPGPFVKPELPLVVEPRSQIGEWIGVDYQQSGLIQGLIIIMPDYRVCIRQVRFEELDAAVEIESNPDLFDESKLNVRATQGYSGRYDELPIKRVNGTCRVTMPRLPTAFHFFATDKETGDVLDWAQVYPAWTNLPTEIVFAIPGQQIVRIIDQGETETVEFKETIGDGFTTIQSVVAFANTSGGQILVGVKDNSSITGTDPILDEKRTREWIEARCDPPISVAFSSVEMSGVKILTVQVPKGSNRPYQHRDNGIFYVRRGATDRPARRSEMDELYKRQPGYQQPGFG